ASVRYRTAGTGDGGGAHRRHGPGGGRGAGRRDPLGGLSSRSLRGGGARDRTRPPRSLPSGDPARPTADGGDPTTAGTARSRTVRGLVGRPRRADRPRFRSNRVSENPEYAHVQ